MSSSVIAIVQYDEAARFGSLAVDDGKVEKDRVGGECRRTSSVKGRCCEGPGGPARRAADAKGRELADARTRL